MQEEYTKETRKENKTTSGIYEIVESLVLAIVCVILIFTFIARMSIVSGASMEPTLHDKDYLVVSNLFFSYNPKHGDVVVAEPDNYHEPIVKRVIAKEGQEVKIVYSMDLGRYGDCVYDVYVDGVLLDERDYAFYNSFNYLYIAPDGAHWTKTSEGALITATTVVPENHLFLMGDNRNNSKDSRSSEIGFVHEDYIVGKCVFRIFPNTGLVK